MIVVMLNGIINSMNDNLALDWSQSSPTWSKLSKKERKKLAKEQKKRLQLLEKRKSSFLTWFGIGIVIFIILFGIVWVAVGIKKDIAKPLPGKAVEDQGKQHVPKSEWEKFKYNSNPPTSGPHDSEWIKKGAYAKPQGDGHLVHSLEHGYVVISHSCEMTSSKLKTQKSKMGTESAKSDKDCLGFVEKLKERVERDSWKLILVPRPNLDTNFALTAWTRIDKFNTEKASMERVEDFIKSYRNKGPEQTME